MSRLLPPLFVGCGVGIILFGARNDLPTPAYFVSIPFWPMLVMPSGLLWRNVIEDKVRKYSTLWTKDNSPPKCETIVSYSCLIARQSSTNYSSIKSAITRFWEPHLWATLTSPESSTTNQLQGNPSPPYSTRQLSGSSSSGCFSWLSAYLVNSGDASSIWRPVRMAACTLAPTLSGCCW